MRLGQAVLRSINRAAPERDYEYKKGDIMFKSIFIGTGLILLSACQAPTTAPVANPIEMPHVKRPNLVVADLDRSVSIYQGILGLKASEPSVSGEDSFSYPVFNIPKGTPMRSLTLSEAGEARVMALTELKGIPLPKPHSAPFMSTVVIGITDLDSKFSALQSMGLEVTETRIAGGVDFKFIEQAFVDPDGHLIVCYEILPD